MRVDYKIDKTLNRIFDEVYQEFKDQGVTRAQVSDIFYMYFRLSTDVLRSYDFPSVKIPLLGRIEASVARLKTFKKHVSVAKDPERRKLAERLGKTIDRIESEHLKRKRTKK